MKIASVSGYYAAIILLSVAFSFVCCFAVVRFTKGFSKWPRRLVRAVLFVLLCPTVNFNFQEGAIPVAPLVYFLTFGYRDLGPGVLEMFFMQPLFVGGIAGAIIIAMAAAASSLQGNPKRQRYMRFAGIACSMPLWFFIASCIFNKEWYDPTDWLPFDSVWLFFCVICAVCSLLSVMMILFSMNEYCTAPSDIVWTVWAAIPVVLVMFVGGFISLGSFYFGCF